MYFQSMHLGTPSRISIQILPHAMTEYSFEIFTSTDFIKITYSCPGTSMKITIVIEILESRVSMGKPYLSTRIFCGKCTVLRSNKGGGSHQYIPSRSIPYVYIKETCARNTECSASGATSTPTSIRQLFTLLGTTVTEKSMNARVDMTHSDDHFIASWSILFHWKSKTTPC